MPTGRWTVLLVAVQGRQVGEVPGAARCPLVRGEIGAAQEGQSLLLDIERLPPRPGLVEGHAADIGQDVDPVGDDTDLESPVGRTQMSRSPVARGRPWAASAWAPTIRNSTPASDSADNISAKSRFIPVSVLERPGLRRELPHHRHPLPRGEPPDVVLAALVLQPQLPGRVVAPIHPVHSRRLQTRGETTGLTAAKRPKALNTRFRSGVAGTGG